MKKILLLGTALIAVSANAQSPELSSWIVNSLIQTGYGGIETNVQQVDYSATNVYVACTCIPGYDIGPWTSNPNTPANQNFVFKITRNPVENTGTKTATPMGHIGVWSNGVSIFNALDGMSYNNQGVWHQDAIPNEGVSFDDCLGHPAPNGEYHTHLNPTCLYDDDNFTVHSNLIGYAFDGFPVYGAYGYTNPDGTGGILRMTSSYQLRTMTTRTTLPNGSAASSAGPTVAATPLGKYIEDYEYVSGLGTLDEYNGRFCVTPDYPAGTYAYFVTIDGSGNGVYPYVVGPKYYGTVQSGNTGPASGHNTISETVANFSTAGIQTLEELQLEIYPNPVAEQLFLSAGREVLIESCKVVSANGKVMAEELPVAFVMTNGIDVYALPAGAYFLIVAVSGVDYTLRFVK